MILVDFIIDWFYFDHFDSGLCLLLQVTVVHNIPLCCAYIFYLTRTIFTGLKLKLLSSLISKKTFYKLSNVHYAKIKVTGNQSYQANSVK